MKKILIILSILLTFIAVKGFGYEAGDIQIHGYVSQGYLKSDRNNFIAETEEGSFQFNETCINFSTYLSPGLRAGMQLLARDFGSVGNDEVEIDWAYGDYQWRDELGIRAGKIRIPLGFHTETRDIDMTRSSILLPAGVYNESWRDVFSALKGVGIYGEIDLNKLGSLSYQGLAGDLGLDNESGIFKYMDDLIYSTTYDVDTDAVYAANVRWETPVSGLRFEASAMWTKWDAKFTTDDGHYWRRMTVDTIYKETGIQTDYETAKTYFDLVGMDVKMPVKSFPYMLSAEYTRENLRVIAEYYELTSDYSLVLESLSMNLDEGTEHQQGYYGGVEYRFTDWLEMGLYYSEFYPDKYDKSGDYKVSYYKLPNHTAWIKDTCLSVRFDINLNWILKLEGHMMDGTAILHRTDNLDGMDKDWFLFAAKVTFSF
ncbi:MAG: hypothetical protein GY795_47690 [Desulfobacterales bacterium]|nr:hypothetical protein [Desulfobacterales bacterium]